MQSRDTIGTKYNLKSSASSYLPASSKPLVRGTVLAICTQVFLIFRASVSDLYPFWMLLDSCPTCTWAKASCAQQKASDARIVKNWVSGAPVTKEGSESPFEGTGPFPRSA